MPVPHLPPRYPPTSTTVPVSPSPYPPKSHTLPHSGEAYYARPHLRPRYPPPSAIPSTPPYTILYIEGSPYPITEYPLYIME